MIFEANFHVLNVIKRGLAAWNQLHRGMTGFKLEKSIRWQDVDVAQPNADAVVAVACTSTAKMKGT